MGIIVHPMNALAQGGPPMITDDPGTPGDGQALGEQYRVHA